MVSLLKKVLSRLQSRYRDTIAYIICGLGNKGEQYSNTRHNFGFIIVDALLQKCEEITREKKYSSTVVVSRLSSGKRIACAKPQTYVNRSGIAVKHLLKRYGLPLSSCLIIVDDFNLPLGSLRFRRRGSDGGHNGLRSIIAETGQDFPRLRIGIGPVPDNTAIIDFVLGGFEDYEIEKRDVAVVKSVDAILFFCKNGIEAAMNHFNT